MGVLEEGAKAAGGVVEALRAQPLQLANIVLNIAFLIFLFYYVSIIATRAQGVVNSLFVANDKMYSQWATVLKDQQGLTEKVMHCILPEDAIKLLQAPRPQQQRNQDPDWLAPLRAIPLRFGPTPPAPITKLPLPEITPPLPLDQLTKPENKPEEPK